MPVTESESEVPGEEGAAAVPKPELPGGEETQRTDAEFGSAVSALAVAEYAVPEEEDEMMVTASEFETAEGSGLATPESMDSDEGGEIVVAAAYETQSFQESTLSAPEDVPPDEMVVTISEFQPAAQSTLQEPILPDEEEEMIVAEPEVQLVEESTTAVAEPTLPDEENAMIVAESEVQSTEESNTAAAEPTLPDEENRMIVSESEVQSTEESTTAVAGPTPPDEENAMIVADSEVQSTEESTPAVAEPTLPSKPEPDEEVVDESEFQSASKNTPAGPIPKRAISSKSSKKATITAQLKNLQEDPLLLRCIRILDDGALVWAQDQGSVYWPACVVPIPPAGDGEEEGVPDAELAKEFAFVMFIEPKFRLGMIKWANIIEVDFDRMELQKGLVNDLNKLLHKQKSRKFSLANSFEKSCEMMTELFDVSDHNRQEFMQKKFVELNNERKQKTKVARVRRSTSESRDIKKAEKQTASDSAQSSSTANLVFNETIRTASGLRQKPPVTKKWNYPSSSVPSAQVAPMESEEQDAESNQPPTTVPAKKATTSRLLRPKCLEGEALQTWTLEKFDLMDKAMKFDSKPYVCCAKCKEEMTDETEVATCHDYPFHKSCLSEVQIAQSPDVDGHENVLTKFKCDDCIAQVCFICKKGDSEVFGVPAKCSIPKCDLRFHRDCLVFNWPQADVFGSNGLITCPLHFCHGCKAEHLHSAIVRDYRLQPSKAIRCLYCLSAYHKPSCIPAGTGNNIMKNQFLICPRHARDKAPARKNKRLGCFTCSSKLKSNDVVVNCSLCPLSFHATCVHGEFHLKAGISLEELQKTFKCEACLWGMFPRYGQVVWFQQPGSIYWPSMILYPKDGAARGATKDGQFSVGYCGYPIQFYDNGRTGDSLPLEIGNKDFLKKLNLFSNDKVGEAAKEAYQLLKYSEENRNKLLPKPEPIFKKIDRNLYRVHMSAVNRNGAKKNGGKRKNDDEDEERCVCGTDKEDDAPKCTPNSGCFNRDAAVECNATNCSGNDKCENRMFTLKQNKEHLLETFVSPSTKGWGLKAMAAFTEGTYLCEYIGEVISKDEVMWRVQRKADDDPLYFLEIDSSTFIDAEYYGNVGRLINHSCDPNCRIVKYDSAQGKRVVGIFAKRDIEAGEELTFDYNYGSKSTFSFNCFCRAVSCKGVIGRRRENEENLVPAGNKKGSQEYHVHEAKWEDECATCGMRGELLMCEFDGCAKAYHLHCVDLTATPKGTWNCALHVEGDGNAEPVERKGTLQPYKLRLKGPPSKKRKVATKAKAKKTAAVKVQNK